jgi:hypothetical protein
MVPLPAKVDACPNPNQVRDTPNAIHPNGYAARMASHLPIFFLTNAAVAITLRADLRILQKAQISADRS